MRGCSLWLTGAGKSVIISDVARMTTLKGNRVLFLVHRKELIEQIQETFELNNVDMKLVQFGMVQTIVKRLDRTIKPDLIITDENHHGMAASYRKIYDHFHDVLRLGFTATPIRLNGSGLGDVNDILIEEVDAKWLIEHNYLSPYKYYAPKLIDITKLKLNSLREFSSTSIDNALDDNTIYGDVVKHYKELADGEQAIAYCHSIKASQLTAEQFNKNGINAIHLDGKTPKDEREEIIKKFRNKEISILCNVDLVGEGFNVPDCSTVIMLRPTQSLSLFIQQSMRGMRYKPNKTSIIIDHVDNVRRHGLPDMERAWSLEGKKSSKKQQETEVKIKQCDSCFAVYSPEEKACPLCGHVPEVKERKDYEIEETAELEEVKEEDKQAIKLNFKKPEECNSFAELAELGKALGYKPGWSYYQAKSRGFVR
ncbi:helicase [Oceanobacillus sp. E9]|uniref:DEAD/DEAH box helicase n=1 Tax=Oceanobacillus sp. E9 TaxID=1742575 RepID=UPI00084E3E0A|nr:DEAD/DEAH box helicase [Oceanobacillus sp. E9]OEH55923.1 helicase [Oceanobacillus sp. E9]